MINSPLRSDSYGHGAYLAPRGSRLHLGHDFHGEAGQRFFSDVSGEVVRIGYPYSRLGPKSEYKLIEIKHGPQTIVKYMYLDPNVQPGDQILRGDWIGTVQDLTKVYPKTATREAMTCHVHFEVIVEGDHVDPIQWLEARGWA
jgi:murein DD-endopeptidase MepM/ murein hydrolase activator NlpD